MANRQQFAVIGIGQTGFFLARHLTHLGHDVIAVDREEDRIQDITPYVAQAIVADCTRKKQCQSLPISEAEAVIIAIGDSLEDSLLTILNLKEIGIKNIVAKSASEQHSSILAKLGVTEIFHPERDMAVALAERLNRPNMLEFLPFMEGYSIVEWALPEELSGKSLLDLNLTNKYGVQVIAIKDAMTNKVSIVPKASATLLDTNVLFLLGSNEALEKLMKKMDA
ncbi:MAG TPA: TrkA family potassium uptake protein [Fibrobacteraceae bacterium]|nr:TrkA family potassium uptake protein [Fibrobacteraceae bacterium]